MPCQHSEFYFKLHTEIEKNEEYFCGQIWECETLTVSSSTKLAILRQRTLASRASSMNESMKSMAANIQFLMDMKEG